MSNTPPEITLNLRNNERGFVIELTRPDKSIRTAYFVDGHDRDTLLAKLADVIPEDFTSPGSPSEAEEV